LRKWICSPLLKVDEINSRLDAIEELEQNQEKRQKFRNQIQKLPDFERLCGKVYNLSVKRKINAFFIGEVEIQRLKEFKLLLENFK
jgi:DNA mismatch repair protein MSH6